MKANKAEEQALIALLNRLYGEIRAIEVDLNIRVDEKDFRPRIDYFHDAVRALTSQGGTGRRGGRLSIEMLAYDISMLRYIQGNPLKQNKEAGLSPVTAVGFAATPSDSVDKTNVKRSLGELYKHYAVIFVALLSDAADHNYYSRTEECNAEVEGISGLEQVVKAAAQKKDTEIDIESLMDQVIEDPDLAAKILLYFQGGKQKKLLASEAARKCREMMNAADKELKTVEQAHLTYVTSQLAVYENAKDVVKKMAVQGLNIVGDFVQNAVSEASRSGRGM